MTDDSGNVNNVIQVFVTGEEETKVYEINDQALPVKEDRPARKVPSKDTLSSKKTTPSESTVVDQNETSSVQSILREAAVENTTQQQPEAQSPKHQQQESAANQRG